MSKKWYPSEFLMFLALTIFLIGFACALVILEHFFPIAMRYIMFFIATGSFCWAIYYLAKCILWVEKSR